MKDPYVYENTDVLINKLGIKQFDDLKKAEADISFVKLLNIDENVIPKEFDLEYLKEINKYILEDIYDWAGDIRTVPIEKPEDVLGGDTVRYAYPKEIEKNAKNCLNRMNETNWVQKELDDKAMSFSKSIAELWQIHPFREGNTRTIITFAFRFAKEHGFEMDKDLLINNFVYLRKALVKASDGQYSEYEYLFKIIKDSIQRGSLKNSQEIERD